MSAKILFIYHGGTIGQKPKMLNQHLTLVPPNNDQDLKLSLAPILKQIKHKYGYQITFEVMTVQDSSNLTPENWTKLIYRIEQAQKQEKYQAVAIAHGTDTLAYTANAVAFGFNSGLPKQNILKIPVVFTGAQSTIDNDHGDAKFNLANLFATINFALKYELNEVLINFGHKVLLACRSIKNHTVDFNAFHSPNYPPIGIINSQGVNLNLPLTKTKITNNGDIKANFAGNVLIIEIIPGFDPELILNIILHNKINAVVLKGFGDGNVCTQGQLSFLPLIKTLTAKNIPVIITSQVINGGTSSLAYEVGLESIKAGAISSMDQTHTSIAVKLKWLIGNKICHTVEDFKQAMYTSYIGEVTEL